MIRAVNRYTLEINKTGSPYFERAICFVKPEYAQSDRLDLHRAAQQLISAFDAGVEEQTVLNELVSAGSPSVPDAETLARPMVVKRLLKLLPLALSAILGAGVTLLIVLLV